MSNDPLSPIKRPTWLGKAPRDRIPEEELKKAAAEIESDPGLARNGWTPIKLAAYFKERNAAQFNRVFPSRPPRPMRTVGWHNPHRWRR